MAGATYKSPEGRINRLKGEILRHAVPTEVLGITGQQKPIPPNQGKTVTYRRYLPHGAVASDPVDGINQWSVDPADHILQEGITPDADSLVPQDITAQLQQFGCLYQVTDQTVDLHEDNIPEEMKKLCGERIGLLRELVRWGTLKGGTNVYYAGGNSRSTVDAKLNISLSRQVSRQLQANHAKRITGILSASPDFGTTPVEASYLAFAHTDCDSDIRDLPGFIPVAEYGQRKPVHPQEIGSVENKRYILSPELKPYPNAGAAVGATGLYSTGGTNIDVYPIVYVGEDAWGQLAMRGKNSLDPTWIPPGEKSKDDPLGQRGFIGAKFYMNCVRLNEGWMAVVEVGVTDLV